MDLLPKRQSANVEAQKIILKLSNPFNNLLNQVGHHEEREFSYFFPKALIHFSTILGNIGCRFFLLWANSVNAGFCLI